MRVLYFSGGYSTHDYRFLSALAGTEHRVYFLKLEKQEHAIERRPVPAEIQQIAWAGGRGSFRWHDVPRLVMDLRRVIAVVQPDLIHAGPVQTSAFLSILTGFRPVLTMSWGYDLMQDADRDAWWRGVTRYTLHRSTYFVSDAEASRDKAVAYGMKRDRTRVFPWGVDLSHFKPGGTVRYHRTAGRSQVSRARSGADKAAADKRFVLLCNRSWEHRYGVDVLAKAFVQAAALHPGLSLLLLGSGSQSAAIRQILLDGEVAHRVHFAGRVAYSDLLRWYRKADLFVSPSHVDGSSVSLMEALACGVPSLVSDIPANKEWVHEGRNGWLFPDGNVDALTEKILAIASTRRSFPAVSRAARRTAVQRADWRRNFPVLLKAYERAVELK